MNLKSNINRLFSKEDIKLLGLPIYDLTKADDVGIPFDFCTRSQLKLLKIELNEEQKKMIKGFVRIKGYRGFAALYSFKELRNLL